MEWPLKTCLGVYSQMIGQFPGTAKSSGNKLINTETCCHCNMWEEMDKVSFCFVWNITLLSQFTNIEKQSGDTLLTNWLHIYSQQ